MSELHIYAQEQWHDEAYILGTREALEKLRQAIGEVLCDQESVAKEEFFCGDGEGYQVYIKLVSSDQMDEVNLPYTDIPPCTNLRQYRTKLSPSALIFPAK